MKGGQGVVKEVKGKGTCIGKKPVGEEVFTSGRSSSLNFMGFGEFYFQLVVKLWYFDVNRYGLVCLKVGECLLSDWWRGSKKEKVREKKRPEKSCSIVDKHEPPSSPLS